MSQSGERAFRQRENVKRLAYPALYPDLGIWHASRRDTGAFIGWFSLKYAGKSPDVEIGYWLLPNAWGHGFATEGAQAMADYGFDYLGLHRIIGVTHPGNKASQRVLMKAGLEDRGWGRYYNRRLRLFVADNPYRSVARSRCAGHSRNRVSFRSTPRYCWPTLSAGIAHG